MARPVLFIFARAPAYGAAKTRLARDVGAAEALRFQRHALRSVIRHFAGSPRVEVVLAVTPRSRLSDPAWPRGLARVDQGRGDLGVRMMQTLRLAGRRPALLIGSDIPEARAHHIEDALGCLTRARFVLGPTEDGGYWLIGARMPWLITPRLLDDVRWSSRHALEDTRARLRDVALLGETLSDVDDGESLSRLKLREGRHQSRHI